MLLPANGSTSTKQLTAIAEGKVGSRMHVDNVPDVTSPGVRGWVQDAKVAAAVEGADAPALTTAVTAHVGEAGAGLSGAAAGAAVKAAVDGTLDPAAPAAVQGAANDGGAGAGLDRALRQRLRQLTTASPVMLFMKVVLFPRPHPPGQPPSSAAVLPVGACPCPHLTHVSLLRLCKLSWLMAGQAFRTGRVEKCTPQGEP